MKRSFTTATISFLTVAFVASMYINTSAFGAFIRAEPDNYPENSAIPDNIGVKLRNCDYPPNHPEFNRPWRRIYAKSVSPRDSIQCPPTTGFLVLGNDYCHYYNGYNYGLRAFFDSPTSFVSFDILWATETDGSEGAYVTVYGNDINGNEVTIFSRGYRPSGSHTTFSLSHAGITRLKVICWDDPRYFRQKAFSVDDFRFIDTSGTAWTLQEGDVIEAPNGFDLGGDDSLGGNGVINGDVNNAGLITPGESVGQITIEGDYTQTADGSFVAEISGSGVCDLLTVTGAAQLAGTLDIVLLDGYTPSLGERFRIMTYESRTGEFDSVLGQEFDNKQFELDYGSTGLDLVVVPEPATLVLLGPGGCLALLRRKK